MALTSTDREGLIKLRPLLEARREEINGYVRAHDLPVREDSSNASLQHRRNRLRHEALPLLVDICQRDVVETMVRGARFAGRDEAFLRETALRLAQEEGLWEADGALAVTPRLKAAHFSIQARIVRHWLVKTLKMKGVGSHEIEGVVGLLENENVAKLNLPGGACVRRKAKRLFVETAQPAAAEKAAALRKASI
jgi:tRNA(Ile)-lysidine synthase